ncbi:hypothetical protein V491_09209 [Pseudogymnoascus sp. VKM F-3775]|nr:hypothetical protein V491_09209 [Pseudogymnoascus sp. VKM F-3775]
MNAESYGDSPAIYKDEIPKHKVLPFGINEPLQDHDSGPRHKKPRIENRRSDGIEGVKGKAWGRATIDDMDEATTDRRRTQIRLAQRAYRHRKETMISSLEKKVRDLTGVNEEMSCVFISLYDSAAKIGLLQREPEFAQKMQVCTKGCLALAKTTADAAHDKNQDGGQDDGVQDEGVQDEAEHGVIQEMVRRAQKETTQKQNLFLSPPCLTRQK